MKKLTLTITALALVAGISLFSSAPRGLAADADGVAAHKIGLIDMAHIFKEYKKFAALREDLKTEITKSESKARGMHEGIQSLQLELKELKEGSPEFAEVETKLAKATSEFDAYRKVAQRDFLRKEAEIYKQVYLEVSDTVSQYADAYNYTLVIRFNRASVDGATVPKDIIQGMNQQVVYHRKQDDITEPILDYLNKKYGPGAARPQRDARSNPERRRRQ